MVSEPKFWRERKGRIIRAIVLDGSYTKREMLETTRLDGSQFEQAFVELFLSELVVEKEKDRFLVNSSKLCNEYRSYEKEVKQTLLEWVNEWKKQERISTELNHFFLEDKLLDKFSENLIENAKLEILVASPYVEQCHVSNLLISMSQKGIDTKLLTRSVKLDQYNYEKKVKYLSKTCSRRSSRNL